MIGAVRLLVYAFMACGGTTLPFRYVCINCVKKTGFIVEMCNFLAKFPECRISCSLLDVVLLGTLCFGGMYVLHFDSGMG